MQEPVIHTQTPLKQESNEKNEIEESLINQEKLKDFCESPKICYKQNEGLKLRSQDKVNIKEVDTGEKELILDPNANPEPFSQNEII